MGWSPSCIAIGVIVPLISRPETEPRQVEAELLTVLDSVQAGVMLMGAGGRLRYANARFGQYFGVEQTRLERLETIVELEELIAPRFQTPEGFAQRWKQFVAGDDRPAHDELEMLLPVRRVLERFARPVVELRALKSRNFALGCFFSFMTGVGIFATIYLTPLFLGRVRGFSAWQIGLAVFSTGIFQVLAIPFYTFLARKIDLRWLMLFGLACFTFSMWNFTPITHDWGWRELLIPQAFRGFSQQFAVAPTVTLTLGVIPPERLKLASGLFNLMRNLGGAIGIAGCSTILNDRTNLHFLRLAEHLNNTNTAMIDLLSRAGAKATILSGGDAVMGHAIAIRQLWSLTMREAQTQTYSDAFLALMLCLGLATVMVPLMRKVAPPKAPVADGH